MGKVEARDIMKTKLVTLSPEDSVHDAIQTLLKHSISGAPVVDEEGKLVGMFSERSCMKVLLADAYHEMPKAHVGTYMLEDLITITENTGLLEIGQIFLGKSLRRLPVLRDGRLVGQVSRRDVLQVMQDEGQIPRSSADRQSGTLYLSATEKSSKDVPID